MGLAEVQCLLARLYTDAETRERYFADPRSTSEAYGLTTVDAEPEGDTFMPVFDMSEWHETSAQSFGPDEKHAYGYRFAVLDRDPTKRRSESSATTKAGAATISALGQDRT